MKLGMSAQHLSEERLQYVKQLGSDGIFLDAGDLPGYNERGYATVDELAAAKRTVAAYELEILNLRTQATDTAPILQGLPDRDQAIDRICATVRAAGAVGIPTVFYNLTVWRSLGTSWGNYRGVPGPGPGDLDNGSGPGRYRRPVGRGGAVLLTHSKARAAEDAAHSPAEVVAPYGQISADEMWERVQYFYERVIPVAEEAGVNVGAHPDDPPERHYRGVEQILNNFEGLKAAHRAGAQPAQWATALLWHPARDGWRYARRHRTLPTTRAENLQLPLPQPARHGAGGLLPGRLSRPRRH